MYMNLNEYSFSNHCDKLDSFVLNANSLIMLWNDGIWIYIWIKKHDVSSNLWKIKSNSFRSNWLINKLVFYTISTIFQAYNDSFTWWYNTFTSLSPKKMYILPTSSIISELPVSFIYSKGAPTMISIKLSPSASKTHRDCPKPPPNWSKYKVHQVKKIFIHAIFISYLISKP